MAYARSSPFSARKLPAVPPEFESIPAEKWRAAKAPIMRVLNRVHPTSDSEDYRIELTNFMKQIIMNVGAIEVSEYGSVPLKTFLPQGDIDLTSISIPELERNFPRDVYNALLDEQLYGNKEFEIKEIKFVDAEVKIVKCIVNDVAVDVSFNQLSGLCALCFLEQVDRLIGKNHLFKRSIIVIKSWCYYESHTLGAIHGLFSTYALEVLVLYIFLMYHKSLNCPLKVLYRFLEYYSKFDWGNFCISIDGPVRISSLPNIVVESPIDHHSIFGDRLREYINIYTVPCKEFLGDMPTFTPKIINIIDPLKVSNNLGRSIHLGTFYRITLALSRGARELGAIMSLSKENIQRGIEGFFKCALKMNESKLIINSTSLDMNESEVEKQHLNPAGTNETSGAKVDKRSSPDNGNKAASGVYDECDRLKLAGLYGDYHGSVRKLLHSQCCKGFPYFTFLLNEVAGLTLDEWFELNSSPGQAYPSGSVMRPTPILAVHGNAQYVPPMGPPMRENEWGYMPVQPFTNHQLNWADGDTYEMGSSSVVNSSEPDSQFPQGHGQSGAPSPVQTQRKLLFGTFGLVGPTNPEPESTYFLCAGSHERVVNNALSLMDESEFPPLAV